jgi:hypothetical protein
MKPDRTTSPNTSSTRFTGMHWFISIIGILTAVACSFVLLNDVQTEHRSKTVSINIPKSAFIHTLPTREAVTSFAIRVMF